MEACYHLVKVAGALTGAGNSLQVICVRHNERPLSLAFYLLYVNLGLISFRQSLQ